MEEILNTIRGLIIEYAPRLAASIAVLIIGLWVISLIGGAFSRMLDKRNVDPSLKPFLKGIATGMLKVMLFLSVLGMLGIEMTSFIAVLGAIGLAIGLAMSGTLQNFAGGVVILLIKPFKAGDFIEAQGHFGTVDQIQIFYTILKTPDNRTVILPNGDMSKNALVNFTAEPKRRVDLTFGIGYGDRIEQAKEVLLEIIRNDNRILNEPEEPFIAVSALADSSVNLIVKLWVKTDDYWGVYHDTQEKVYDAFSSAGLNIPYPQMDIHVHQNN